MSLQLMLTNTFLRRFFRGRPGARIDPPTARALMQRSMRWVKPVPPDIVHRHVAADAAQQLCPAQWFCVRQPQRTVLCLHGGGYFFGNPDNYRQFTSVLARQVKAQVVSLDYRLAPENPFPAAVDDVLAWYRHLLHGGIPPEKIVVLGDSAGGGLAVSLLVAARDAGLPMPACGVLFSPWTDLSCSGNSMRANRHTDVMFQYQWFADGADWYLQGADPHTPLASPLFADLHGLPPLLVFASAHEMLRDDAVRLCDKAKEQGVQATLVLRPAMPHVWPVMTFLPEARLALEQVAGFMLRQA